MERIKIIQTGGTIDKDYPKSIGGYAFEIAESAAEKIIRKILPQNSFELKTVCKKDSQDITDEDREKMVEECNAGDTVRILITHGTDTMMETARFLSDKVRAGRQVVLTGALKPAAFRDTDAEFNVGFAVGVLQGHLQGHLEDRAEGSSTAGGVFVAMNGQISQAFPTSAGMTRNTDTGHFEKI